MATDAILSPTRSCKARVAACCHAHAPTSWDACECQPQETNIECGRWFDVPWKPFHTYFYDGRFCDCFGTVGTYKFYLPCGLTMLVKDLAIGTGLDTWWCVGSNLHEHKSGSLAAVATLASTFAKRCVRLLHQNRKKRWLPFHIRISEYRSTHISNLGSQMLEIHSVLGLDRSGLKEAILFGSQPSLSTTTKHPGSSMQLAEAPIGLLQTSSWRCYLRVELSMVIWSWCDWCPDFASTIQRTDPV